MSNVIDFTVNEFSIDENYDPTTKESSRILAETDVNSNFNATNFQNEKYFYKVQNGKLHSKFNSSDTELETSVVEVDGAKLTVDSEKFLEIFLVLNANRSNTKGPMFSYPKVFVINGDIPGAINSKARPHIRDFQRIIFIENENKNNKTRNIWIHDIYPNDFSLGKSKILNKSQLKVDTFLFSFHEGKVTNFTLESGTIKNQLENIFYCFSADSQKNFELYPIKVPDFNEKKLSLEKIGKPNMNYCIAYLVEYYSRNRERANIYWGGQVLTYLSTYKENIKKMVTTSVIMNDILNIAPRLSSEQRKTIVPGNQLDNFKIQKIFQYIKN